MAFTDYLFATEHFPNSYGETSKIQGRPKEDIASAVSLLIYMLSDYRAFVLNDAKRVDEHYILGGEIEHLIINACYILDIKDIEIKIAHFNYTVDKFDSTLKIIAPTESFEKCLQLGFIRSELQYDNDNIATTRNKSMENTLSFEDLANDLLSIPGYEMFTFRNDKGYERYALDIPYGLIQGVSEKLLKPDSLFREEYIYLSHILEQQMLDMNKINSAKIKENLTILEFFKILRVFSLLHYMFTRTLINGGDVQYVHKMRSIIPVFRDEDIYDMLGLVASEEGISDFLDIVCWERGDKRLFDLQYHPIIYIEGFYLTSLSLFAKSNPIRNLYASEYKRNNVNLNTDGIVDPISDRLIHTFFEKGYSCTQGINYRNITDIDFMVRIENTLIILECKQSILPASIHDLRTSYDYIKKAEEQLGLFEKDYHNGILFGELSRRTNMDMDGVTNLILGIVTSNKMFNGNIFKYPVRNIHELDSLVSNGTIVTSDGTYNIWEKEEFELKDFERYLHNNEILDGLLDMLEPKLLTYNIGEILLEEKTYLLRIDLATEKLRTLTTRYRQIDSYKAGD